MTGKPFDGVEYVLLARLRHLAKNMTAISKGGGKSGELVDQIVKVAESLIAYDQTFGTRPEEDLIRHALAEVALDEEV
jgi:hypothetical protein